MTLDVQTQTNDRMQAITDYVSKANEQIEFHLAEIRKIKARRRKWLVADNRNKKLLADLEPSPQLDIVEQVPSIETVC